jgi:hypothetical protein
VTHLLWLPSLASLDWNFNVLEKPVAVLPLLVMAIVGADFGSLRALPTGHIIILAFPSYVLFIFHNLFYCALNQYRTPILLLWGFLNLNCQRSQIHTAKWRYVFVPKPCANEYSTSKMSSL